MDWEYAVMGLNKTTAALQLVLAAPLASPAIRSAQALSVTAR